MQNEPICRSCNEVMDRIKRTKVDRLIDVMFLGLLEYRRFYCCGCMKSKLLSKFSYEKRNIIQY